MAISTDPKKKLGANELTLGATIPRPATSLDFKTGDWRSIRPVKDDSKCTKCMICWMFCPEPAISVNDAGAVVINYDYCKGCGICAKECPVKCIKMVEESSGEK